MKTLEKCIKCGTTESPAWVKCCRKHTSKGGSDALCLECAFEFHPEERDNGASRQ